MPETLLLAIGLAVAGTIVLAPLRRPPAPTVDDEREAAAVRHRVALETLRDVDADRRAGSLDERAYAEQLAEAEARAAATAADLAASAPERQVADPPRGRGRAAAVTVAALLGIGLVGGSLVPAAGVANGTALNCPLALSRPNGEERRECLDRLLEELAANPNDAAALSRLADAYLAGDGPDDLANAVRVLRAVIGLEPDRADAYERSVAAYLRAGDPVNARRALDAYAERETADPVELAFLDGLIALRENDSERAAEAFDRFLELAPDDPRGPMIRELRDDVASD